MQQLVPLSALGLIVLAPVDAAAQMAVPNRMAPHTLAIILIVGAFLAWAASFSIQTMRRRTGQEERKELEALRESILDRLAALEQARDSGEIAAPEFERRKREARSELVRVAAKLGMPKARGKRA